MKRILFISNGFGPGGAERQCVQLFDMLIDRGYHVDVLTFEDIPDHYPLPLKVKRVRLAQNKALWRKLLSVELHLLFAKADVIFAYSQRMSVLTLFPMLFRPDIKVISSERNFTIDSPTIFEKILFKTKVYKRADYIVPNSYSQGRYLSKKMPSLTKKIKVITNYTQLDSYKYKPVEIHGDIKIGLFCRLEKQKNFHGFIKMLSILIPRIKKEIHVDWYGANTFASDAQKRYYEEGVKMIREYGLDDILTIKGVTNDVPELIPKYDVLCLPSFKEGFSNSISEYICCGRPVLCSDVSDNSMMVHNGENGFLFNPHDIESMTSAFERYINTTEEVKKDMCLKSRAIAEDLFDKNRFIDSYVELIEK